MAMYLVPNLPLLGQDKTNGCWYFSAKMIAKWSSKHGGSVEDPESIGVLANLYGGNCGYALETCAALGQKIGMEALPRKDYGFSELLSLLKDGPLWAAGFKGGVENGFEHVVVIGGVASTGVLIHDPLPLKVGMRSWKTWSWFKSFLALEDDTIDANLLSPIY